MSSRGRPIPFTWTELEGYCGKQRGSSQQERGWLKRQGRHSGSLQVDGPSVLRACPPTTPVRAPLTETGRRGEAVAVSDPQIEQLSFPRWRVHPANNPGPHNVLEHSSPVALAVSTPAPFGPARREHHAADRLEWASSMC